MAVAIKKVTLWRTEVENKPGALRSVLAPLAEVGADLQVVMGYRHPGGKHKATIEVAPVLGRKATAAANKAGLAASAIPALLVQGDNRPGLGHAIAEAIAEARINLAFFVAQVIDAQFSAVLGFPSEAAAKRAAALIKKAVKELEKQLPPSDACAEAHNGSSFARSRAPILCRKKCDVLLNAFCSDFLR